MVKKSQVFKIIIRIDDGFINTYSFYKHLYNIKTITKRDDDNDRFKEVIEYG